MVGERERELYVIHNMFKDVLLYKGTFFSFIFQANDSEKVKGTDTGWSSS